MTHDLLNHKSKCRLCFQRISASRNSVKITEKVQNKFFALANIELKSSDKFSNHICKSCIKCLNDSCDFQQKIVDNQRRLYAFEEDYRKLIVKAEPIELSAIKLQEFYPFSFLPKAEAFDDISEDNPKLVTPEQDETSRSESTEELKTSHQDADSRVGDTVDSEPDLKAGKKRRNCSDKQKSKALKAIASGQMSVLEASRHFQVPNTSLRKKFNAVLPEKKIFLTEDEEVQVRIFVKNRNESEMQTTNEDIINCTTRILRQRKKGYRVATPALWSSWVEEFRSRYANYSESQSYEGLVYVCDLCNFTALKKKDLRVHMNFHADNKIMQASLWEFKKYSRIDLDEAERHVSEKLMSIKAAAKLFGIPRTSLSRKVNERIFKCTYCEKVYFSRESLRSHTKKHLEPEGEFKCEECGKVLPTPNRLKNHKLNHKQGVFRCSRCDLVFSNKKDASKHGRSHRPKVACEVCGIIKFKGANYTAHMRTHGEPQFKCPFEGCMKEYHFKGMLSYHIENVHTPKQSIQCPKCDSSFPNALKLKRHNERSHGEAKFFCQVDGCSYKNTRKEYLKLHLRNHKDIDVKLRDELIANIRVHKVDE